jgi:hypothetical protein
MDESKIQYNPLEVARIIGEPRDPRKPYTDMIAAVCEVATADPNEYVYYFDVLNETNIVYNITSAGSVTSTNVAPDAPAALTFIDIATPEYYVKITDLASAKEATLARKLRTINQSLNMYENQYLVNLMDAGAVALGQTHGLSSGNTRFTYLDLITMIQDVVDYGDNYTLFVGSTIDRDMQLWDWNDNKYSSMITAFKDLGIEKIRMGVGNLSVDSSTQRQLTSNKAFLVAKSTEVGKPMLFVRKKLNDIDLLGAAIKQNGDKPERLVFASPNPVNASGGTTRYLAVGLTGYEQVVCASVNPYAISRYIRG